MDIDKQNLEIVRGSKVLVPLFLQVLKYNEEEREEGKERERGRGGGKGSGRRRVREGKKRR